LELGVPPTIPGFTVTETASLPKRNRVRSWPDHTWHAVHNDDPQIVVTAASEAQLVAACDGVRLLTSWRLHLEQGNKSPETIIWYFKNIRTLMTWLADRNLPTDVEQIEPDHLRQFLVDWGERASKQRAAGLYRALNVYFNWCVQEGERTAPSPAGPLERTAPPAKVKHDFTADDLTALVKACEGNDFESRRDMAIIRILMDNGIRVGGLVGLRYTPDDDKTNDVYISRHQLRVRLKGGKEFLAPIGKKAAVALDRYLRVRARHPLAAVSQWLWLPLDNRNRGEPRLGVAGVEQMIERRAEQAGVKGAHPHRFRRTMASNWDGDVTLLQLIGGWESLQMPIFYGKEGQQRKAREAHAKYSPGDKI
jgi:site-specific recombinase XerD